MTCVTLDKTEGRYSIEAQGHAEGSIQACAAVSVLMYSILGYLSNTSGVEVSVADIADGFFSIEFSGGIEARVVYDFCIVAFLQLEASYGEYVTVAVNNSDANVELTPQ